MKINNIEVKRIKNLGNYESLTIAVSGIPSPANKLSEEFDKLTKYIDFKLNEVERKTKYDKYKAELDSGELSEAEAKKATSFITRYNEFMAEIDALEIEFSNDNAEV